MKNRVLFAALALVLAGCAQSATQHASVGAPAPNFSEPTADGTTLTMASLQGKPLWLNFFATWCPPCNEEAPAVSAVRGEYLARGLQVVGVDVLENATKAKQFVDKHQLQYPAVVDSGALRDAYNIDGMPVNVFVDRTGIVRAIEVGELTRAEMEIDVKKIL